jgi:AraC-like DNA-binding protein
MRFVQATCRGDFAGPPERRYFIDRTFFFWQDGARAFGTVMWGRPLEADIEAMIPFFEVGVDERFAGHASFIDARALEAVDMLAFKKLLAYLVARRHAWGPNVRKQAILHPTGLVGVLVAGALHIVRPPYPFACFDGTGADAFAWCDVADLHPDVEALRSSLIASPEIGRAVQAVLEQRGLLGAPEVARTLGISHRTLQRRLRETGTTFRAERERHLSAEIERLLTGTELDLDAIATQVGLSSASHLVAHFRATHGPTPGTWRVAQRIGGRPA